jgi:hypothetical protein
MTLGFVANLAGVHGPLSKQFLPSVDIHSTSPLIFALKGELKSKIQSQGVFLVVGFIPKTPTNTPRSKGDEQELSVIDLVCAS